MAVRQLMKKKSGAPSQGPVENPSGDLVFEYPYTNQGVSGYQKAYATSPTATDVQFYLDNTPISSNYSYRPNSPDLATDQSTYWVNDGINTGNVSNGTHTLKAVASYSDGTITTRTRSIAVNNSVIALPALPEANVISTSDLITESISYPVAKTGPSSYTNTSTNIRYYRQIIKLAADTAYEDTIQVLIPEDVYNAGLAGSSTPVLWFVHGAGSSHATLNATGSGHIHHGRIALAHGCIAISCDYGGTLYSHPTAQRTLRNAYKYLTSRFNISKSFFRGTSHGGALSTLAVGRDLIPNIRGMMLGVGVYDIEERTGNSLGVGVWADPDDVSTSDRYAMQAAGRWNDFLTRSVYYAFDGDRNLAARHNPARLSRFNFVDKNIQLFADDNPTPSKSTYMNNLANGQETKPGDTTVDFQLHGYMFRQNITQHGAPLPASFGFGSSDEGHTESNIPDFNYVYVQMLKNFVDTP
ncbi:MAG: hypothetical protein WAR37_01010 [Candidatus Microsaccharimonas sp.]